MKTLHNEKKENLVYDLSICFERRNNIEEETRMPLQGMPFGLVDYNIRYFSNHSSQKLKMEDRYVRWLETMYAHFGHKWLRLFRRPYWQFEQEENADDIINGLPEPVVDPMCIDDDLPPPKNMDVIYGQPEVNLTNSESSSMNACGDLLPSQKNMHDGFVDSANSMINDVLAELQINLEDVELPEVANEIQLIMENETTSACNSTQMVIPDEGIAEVPCSLPEMDQCQSPEAMESYHRVLPQQGQRKPRNTAMYDTMKVLYWILFY